MTVPDIRIPALPDRPPPDPELVENARDLRLNRILVPLNGSPQAEHALPYASLIARWVSAEITLFHALQPMHPVRVGRPGHVPYPDAQHDRGSHLATSYLEEVAARLRPHNIAARWSVATGNAAPIISTRTVAGGFGLTVISGHPRPRVVRKVQPGVIEELWRLTAAPMMVINHSRVATGSAMVPEPEVIFVPFDGSKTTTAALPIASVLAQAANATLVLLVDRQEKSGKDGGSAGGLSGAPHAAIALETAAGLRAAGCRADVEAISGGDISVARRQIQERGSWVVMGSRMRSGLARMVLGSRGDNYLRQCRGPVIFVPEPSVAAKRSRKAHRDSLLTPESGS